MSLFFEGHLDEGTKTGQRTQNTHLGKFYVTDSSTLNTKNDVTFDLEKLKLVKYIQLGKMFYLIFFFFLCGAERIKNQRK